MAQTHKKRNTNGHRGAHPRTVLLQKRGYLRISHDMIEDSFYGFDPFYFRAERRVELKPASEKTGPATLKLVYGNGNALSPSISAAGLVNNLGIKLPRKSVEYKAEQKPDGTVVVQF